MDPYFTRVTFIVTQRLKCDDASGALASEQFFGFPVPEEIADLHRKVFDVTTNGPWGALDQEIKNDILMKVASRVAAPCFSGSRYSLELEYENSTHRDPRTGRWDPDEDGISRRILVEDAPGTWKPSDPHTVTLEDSSGTPVEYSFEIEYLVSIIAGLD